MPETHTDAPAATDQVAAGNEAEPGGPKLRPHCNKSAVYVSPATLEVVNDPDAA